MDNIQIIQTEVTDKAKLVITLINKAIETSPTGVSFVSIKNYQNKQGAISNYLFNIGINYDKSKEQDIEFLRKLDVTTLEGVKSSKIDLLKAKTDLIEAFINHTYKRFKFLSYEYTKEHYDILVDNIKERNWSFMLKPINAPIFEGITKAKKNTYTHLLLDFCRSIKVHRIDIETALRNDIVKKWGLVWITVSARAGKGVNTYDTLIEIVKKSGGGRYKILEVPDYVTKYRDSSPMVSIIIQRIK